MPPSTGHCTRGLWKQKGQGRTGMYPMEKHLRRKGWRGKGKGQKSRHFIHQTIEERPEEANRRSEIGHWEGDLVYSSFYKLWRFCGDTGRPEIPLPAHRNFHSRKAQEVSDVICRLLKKLPENTCVLSRWTGDRNFQNTVKLQKRFLPANLFCASHVAVERGSNEQIKTYQGFQSCGSTFPKTPIKFRFLQSDWPSLQKS